MPLRRPSVTLLFYKERLGTKSPPHPTRLRRPTYGLWWLRLDLTEQSPGLFDPRGEGFGGVGVSLQGIQSPSVQRTRPGGHVSQSSAGRSRRKRIKSYFPRACTGENIPLTPRVPASPARFGVQPPISRGAPNQTEPLTPPYTAAPNEAQPCRAPLRNSSATAAAPTPAPPAPPG